MGEEAARALKRRLARTWGAFFGRYGGFTPIQQLAIPALLDGENVLLCAATASGKTEAALAPLIERHLPAFRPPDRLTLIYLLPARALIADMNRRTGAALEGLRVRAAVKSRDHTTFTPDRPADILFTTPESLDSLLALHPRALVHVRAVIIDELHLFAQNVRGDHLIVLLRRLAALRRYAHAQGDSETPDVQYAALSATIGDAQASAERFFPGARVITVPGSRPIAAEQIALDADSPGALLAYLRTFRARGLKKALAFCNTRAEVEEYAAAVRAARSPFGEMIFVHYSSIDADRRRETETRFAEAEAALCFASSTLELGIDIGSIDMVLLIGAPSGADSFMQRVGRANRRGGKARAACFYRSPLEHMMFEALLNTPMRYPAPGAFRQSVLVQQIFSLIRQSPTGHIRLQPTHALFEGLASENEVRDILGDLAAAGWLAPARPGEWGAGARLRALIDAQVSEHASLSLHSNIQSAGDMTQVRDQHTHRVLGSVDRHQIDHDSVLLGGRALRITWQDGDALWVSGETGQPAITAAPRLGERPILSRLMAEGIRAACGLPEDAAPYIETDAGWAWFHWLGDVYGHALAALLAERVPAQLGRLPGLCCLLADVPAALPIPFGRDQVMEHVSGAFRSYERMLGLGAYQAMLPLALRRRGVVRAFDISLFEHLLSRARPTAGAPPALDALHRLLA